MFEPTIKYRRVVVDNEDAKVEKSPPDNSKTNTELSSGSSNQNDSNDKETETTTLSSSAITTTINRNDFSFTFEEEEEDKENGCKIEVDPTDKKRIIITLSTGQQYSADRYCPHAGADLSFHGRVSEHDYPPKIGPVLMCSIHYWEFALKKNGQGAGGGCWASINACPLGASSDTPASCANKIDGNSCSKNSVLDW